MRLRALVLSIVVSLGIQNTCRPIEIQFDTSYDRTSFFANGAAMGALEAAADFYESLLLDDLAAIVPGPSGQGDENTWIAKFIDPATGDEASIVDLVVPADTIIVFVGARNLSDLGGSPLARSSSGFGSTGTLEWNNTVISRGQGPVSGPKGVANDYATWGGAIAFNSAVDWHLNAATGPPEETNDLYSVALQELARILGFGRHEIIQNEYTAWANQVTDNTFTGPAAVAEFDAPVPLGEGASQWVNDIPSVIYGTSTSQNAALDDGIEIGTRERLTNLDVAALVDIGWQIEEVVGDYSSDGVINAADYVVWRNTLGSTTDLRADGSGNSRVGSEDYDIWVDRFNNASGHGVALGENVGAGSDGAVPEPNSLVIFLTAVAVNFGYGFRRRR